MEGAKEGSCYSGVLQGGIKISASSFEETARAKEKIEVLSAAAAHPPTPTTKKSTHTNDSEVSQEGSGERVRVEPPNRTSPITTKVRA